MAGALSSKQLFGYLPHCWPFAHARLPKAPERCWLFDPPPLSLILETCLFVLSFVLIIFGQRDIFTYTQVCLHSNAPGSPANPLNDAFS